jgi:antitoxin MazE
MKTTIRRVGNSKGIILPKSLISEPNLGTEVDLGVEGDKIVLRKPRRRVRSGWAEASKKLSGQRGAEPVWPFFANRGDNQLKW